VACPSCGGDTHKTRVTQDGIKLVCLTPDCGRSWSLPDEDGSEEQSAVAAQPSAKSSPKPTASQSMTPVDLLKQAKQQIKALTAEIKRLETLRRQRDELKRLVAAATKPKRGAIVRALRANGE
jgi:uncharacterized Zn finger protein (UPF0148 family)